MATPNSPVTVNAPPAPDRPLGDHAGLAELAQQLGAEATERSLEPPVQITGPEVEQPVNEIPDAAVPLWEDEAVDAAKRVVMPALDAPAETENVVPQNDEVSTETENLTLPEPVAMNTAPLEASEQAPSPEDEARANIAGRLLSGKLSSVNNRATASAVASIVRDSGFTAQLREAVGSEQAQALLDDLTKQAKTVVSPVEFRQMTVTGLVAGEKMLRPAEMGIAGRKDLDRGQSDPRSNSRSATV